MGTPILLLGLCVSVHVFGVSGESQVGCLFSPDVCEAEESCFNDNVFGRCQTENEPLDNYRHLLEPETLSLLDTEMKRLWIGGYRWQHEYTQCVVQSILLSDRKQLHYDPGFCSRLLQMTVPVVSAEILEKLEQIDPSDLALISYSMQWYLQNTINYLFVLDFASNSTLETLESQMERFSPSASHSHPDFADEVFIPQTKQEYGVDKRTMVRTDDDDDDSDNYENQKLLFLAILAYLDQMTNVDTGDSERHPGIKLPVVKTDLSSDLDQQQAFTESGLQWIPVEDKQDPTNNNIDTSSGWDSNWNGYVEAQPGLDNEMWQPLFERPEISVREDPEMVPFRRPMRYDTKKPGPGYYVHEPEPTSQGKLSAEKSSILTLLTKKPRNDQKEKWKSFLEQPLEGSSSLADILLEEENDDEMARKEAPATPYIPSTHIRKQNERPLSKELPLKELEEKSDKRDYFRPSQQETSGLTATQDDQGHLEVIDTTHTYLLLSEGNPGLEDAEHVVQQLQHLLHLPRGTFSNTRVDKNQVTFKVNPNPLNLNASVVASHAEELSESLKKASGYTVTSAGIGDKIKFEVVRKGDDDHRLFVLTFVLCGSVVGVLIAVAVVYVVRRHARSRQKLQNLSQPETEASQDYQDLCRQRMQRKNNEKPEPIHVVQQPKRVSSLSQSETSQPSPSSRSSTSSWSEEPVTSNMDISTGHMILSYMEDHLKNKDRLEREWEALCAYEAEPCATIAATQPQNINKNRFPDVLPYDHSRVILNDISNVSGSDYINASTITDHDPRNPAYIATQGPLPHTAADFWQMIWEQGSVVIVMLTRLMENGFAMCHRYWPEEGSEVYHIYEVHLVSEHIWCDDYLVRSFYLKNLKTSETRTVTQFHFLSWPENGVPASTKALLEFRRKVNKSYRGRSCPIVVHCSDGSGRTGTYCLTDMVLNRMAKGAKEIDIAATLEHIRDQRSGMVKTKAQFEFVLMEIAEEVHAILKALSH